MLPRPGQYVCYFPLEADIELDRLNEPVVDDLNRFYTTNLREAVFAPQIVESVTGVQNLDICGVGYWDDAESFEEIGEGSKDKYCRVLAPDLNYAVSVCDRELLAHLSVSSIKESTSLSEIVEAYDISLESITLRGGPEMEISVLMGANDPDNPIIESQSETRGANSTDSLLSDVRNWMLRNRDQLLANAISGAALKTAEYFLNEPDFPNGPDQGQSYNADGVDETHPGRNER